MPAKDALHQYAELGPDILAQRPVDRDVGAPAPVPARFLSAYLRAASVFYLSRCETVEGAGEVLVNWERIKQEEKGEHHIEHDIPATLPALARAAKVQRRAAGIGFEWRSEQGAMAKLREEVEELAGASSPDEAEAELGDVLFAAVSVGRTFGIDAESALRRSTRTFAQRYEAMLELVRERGLDLDRLSEDQLLALFREARGA